MPRFTQQQLREVLRRDGQNEYVVFLEPGTEPALILPEILAAENVSIQRLPEDLAGAPGPRELAPKAELFQAWIARQNLDVFHATTPFYLEQLVLSHVEACPVVATLYDLIPMIFPAHYLLDERIADDYVRAAGLVAGATRVLAISENARREGNLYLGVPLDAIDIAWPIAEPFFRPLAGDVADSALSRLECDLGLPESIILAVPHLHFSKNIDGLLRGYALVPPAVRSRAPLVLTCHLDPHGEARIRRMARRLRISDDLIITGLVGDDELAALYNRALFVVHPSRYEGFGLPVLEAMQCGTAVITSTSSALPELAGDAAVLVDPEDAPGLADAMVSLIDDPALREELGQRGLARATRFGPDQLAEATLSSYRQAVSGGGPERRHHVVPPARGVGLSKVCEVEDFADVGISAAISDLRLTGFRGRRAWLQAMAVNALRASGAFGPGTRLLLTEESSVAVASCFGDEADVMVSPLSDSDGTGSRLPFDDTTFDAIVSCGSVQRLRSFEEVARAAYDMGRILKPGGVLSISTEMMVAGHPGGAGSPGGLLFSAELLQRYIVDASGLEPVERACFEISTATLESERGMEAVRAGRTGAVRPPPSDPSDQAPLLQLRNGCVAAVVHLTLRRPERYPATANTWAQPPASPEGGQGDNRYHPAILGPDRTDRTAPWPEMADHRRRLELVCSDCMAWQAGIDAVLRDVETMLSTAICDLRLLDDLVGYAASSGSDQAARP